MSWKLVWEPDVGGRTEKEAYAELRANGQAFAPGTLDMMPIDFLARCHWADEEKTGPDDCIIFFYENGDDPRGLVSTSYPTYKGMPAKRVVILPVLQAQGRENELPLRTIRASCGQRFCVNRNHLVVGGLIKNQHRS